MNTQVTEYISKAPENQQNIMAIIRQLIHDNVPDVIEEFKWSRPVFKSKKNFAYLKTAKAYVTLGFFDSNNIDDPDGLLEGTGKDMRHIKLKKEEEINKYQLIGWLKSVTQ